MDAIGESLFYIGGLGGARYEQAEAGFEKALSVEPENVLALLGFGKFLLGMGRPTQAERYLRIGIGTQEGSPRIKGELHAALGLTLYRQGLVEDAVKGNRMAVPLVDGIPSASNILA